jgi:hypothetical protein
LNKAEKPFFQKKWLSIILIPVAKLQEKNQHSTNLQQSSFLAGRAGQA